MLNKSSKWDPSFIMAIVIGVITGLLGFVLFLSIIVLSDKANLTIEDEDALLPVQGSQGPGQGQVQQSTFYALQHGVFSSLESAAQFANSDASLNFAAIIPVGNKYYIWSMIEAEKVENANYTNAFWKQITISNECTNYEELLKTLSKLSENNLLRISEISEKFPQEWLDTIQSLSALVGNPSIMRAQLIALDIEKTHCLRIEF